MKLVLIGLRGTGKSTVGRLLAARLKWPFYDTDTLLQERAGLTIRELFEQFGEAHFRRLESEAVQECALHNPAVIASGGGAILDPKNVEALKQDSFVAHLTAHPSELWSRISHDQSSRENRPRLVQDADSGIDELKKLMRARAAVYAHARGAGVMVEDRSPDQVAEAVLLLLHARGVKV